jgi:periplasmic protein TonB
MKTKIGILIFMLAATLLFFSGKISAQNKTVGEKVYQEVEEWPEFPGGANALRNFISNSIKYPDHALRNRIKGRVYVTFVVAKDGTVTDAKIARGVDPFLDSEALRVANSLPKFKPGKQDGEAVNVSFTMPINFELVDGVTVRP